MNQVNKRSHINRDCIKAMLPSILLYALEETVVVQITIKIAVVLGEFADAIFALNLSWGMENLYWKIYTNLCFVFWQPCLSFRSSVLSGKNLCLITH